MMVAVVMCVGGHVRDSGGIWEVYVRSFIQCDCNGVQSISSTILDWGRAEWMIHFITMAS